MPASDTLLTRQAMAIFDAAAKCSVGIIVFVENQTAIQAATILRRIKKEMGDHTHAGLQIRLSPTNPDQELWIIRRELEPVPASEPKPPPARNEIEILI
jgi:hypothetical protein